MRAYLYFSLLSALLLFLNARTPYHPGSSFTAPALSNKDRSWLLTTRAGTTDEMKIRLVWVFMGLVSMLIVDHDVLGETPKLSSWDIYVY